MKVMHVLTSNKFSGAENVVCQIINLNKKYGDAEMVYVSPDGDIKNALNERGVAFLPLADFTVKSVKKAIKEYKPDIIHAHDRMASFVVSMVKGKIPYISHIHNNFDSGKLSLKSIVYYMAALRAKHIFWVSESSYNDYPFHKSLKKKSSVLKNIIDIESLNEKINLDKNTYNYDVVYVGRLSYQKNPERLMGVIKKCVDKKNDLKVAIIGDGDLLDDTKKLATSLSIDKNIDFSGFMKNPLKIMKDSSVMVMTSRWEGTPMCALEGMICGLPMVSTAVDGLVDLIENDVNGYISDDDEVLAEKIVNIVTDKDLHNRLSEKQIEKSFIVNDSKSYFDKIMYEYKKLIK